MSEQAQPMIPERVQEVAREQIREAFRVLGTISNNLPQWVANHQKGMADMEDRRQKLRSEIEHDFSRGMRKTNGFKLK